MNLLVLANMKPSKADPIRGIFVQNQVDALNRSNKIEQLLFLGIGSGNKSLVGLLKKYLHLLLSVFTQAIFKSQRFDVIHVHYYFPTIWYALVYKWLRNPRAKIVVTFHGSDVNAHQNPSWFYRVANRFVDHHIFVSSGLKEAFFTEPRTFSVLSAGILSCFEPAQTQTSISTPNSSSSKDKTFDFLVIGRLIPSKGIDRLLALMEALPGNLHVGVVGEGPLAQTIKQFQSDKHKLSHLGNCKPQQLASYLHQSKFLLSVSRLESFGLVLTEAMACALPVIATDTVGALSQVREAQNGFLLSNTEQGFVEKNIDKIQACLDSYGTQTYQRVADNAAKSVSLYKLDHIIPEVVSVYENLFSTNNTKDLP